MNNHTISHQIFQNHYDYYKNVGVETIKQQAGQVEQVGADYQGRVIFELLQNAFDKAEKNILVKVHGNTLYVANDGVEFSYVKNFDYEKGSSERGDFQSLCSISTSTKSMATSIGNKGVGFKSAFSIAANDYVNVFTKAEILDNSKRLNEQIAFRIYDSFKKADDIDTDLEKEVRESLKQKIEQLQFERKERGVPGYYFPIQIPITDVIINEFFNNGYVTVIEIPFGTTNEVTVKTLFKEIEKVHFQFVRLKYDKDFEIKFDYNGHVVEKKVEKNCNQFFSIKVKNEEIVKLAKKANIAIEEPVVAFRINHNANGGFFNFLPTKVSSPFKNIDFHADFQTKVDRTSINFDDNSTVGHYNRALLHACIELFLQTVNCYLDENKRVELNLKWIDKGSLKPSAIDFDWNLFQLKEPDRCFQEVKNILRIWDWEYNTAANLITRLTTQYFKQVRSKEQHTAFFDNVSEFIENFSSSTTHYYIWVDRFKDVLARKVLEESCMIIPNVAVSRSNEVFYKKNSDSNFNLPHFIGVNITDFEIKDKALRKKLGIKEFEDYNEILRYFKQVTFAGDYERERLSDDEQIKLLKSLAEIISSKKEDFLVFSHRYSRTFTSDERRNSSSINQAYFNISTIFLKTITKNYKPAQLCRKNELDLDFLAALNLGDKLDVFLKSLGVSLDQQFIIADKRIYDRLNSGLEYIPALIKRDEGVDKLFASILLESISLIDVQGNVVHPALINDNTYNFLVNISGRNIKAELENLLVKSYERFPVEYLDILFERLEHFPAGIERLYLSLFHPFHQMNKYLISTNGNYEWKSNNDVFFIAQNRFDYDVLRRHDIPLLCFFNGNDVPNELASRKISLKESEIVTEEFPEASEYYLNLLKNMMPYLLAAISNTTLSELNFKDSSNRIKEIQELLTGCQIYQCEKLFRKIICEEAKLEFESVSEATFEKDTKRIYFQKNCSKRTLSQLFARYLFNNSSITSEVELVLFFKKIPDLELDYPKEDINLFKRLWLKDYEQKFKEFEVEVLSEFVDEPNRINSLWYIYNKSHKSETLLHVYQKGKLNDLEKRIEICKGKYDGLFDDFHLNIDYSINDTLISNMILSLQQKNIQEDMYLIKELKNLSRSIGKEERLKEIEQLLKDKNYFGSSGFIIEDKDLAKPQLEFERKVNNIFEKLPAVKKLTTLQLQAEGNPELINLKVNSKKVIFQGVDSEKTGIFLEQTGANGEELVLGFYIQEFLFLPTEQRRDAIQQIYQVIEKKLGNNSHIQFKDNCLEVIDNNEELSKALIPFFYITMHHKYSYFDLVAYKDNKPIVVEVKSTNSYNNDGFYISIAEVNEARNEDNYEIVRVTPTEIIFMGNPIKVMGDKISSIDGDNYKMIPRNFKFEFSRN